MSSFNLPQDFVDLIEMFEKHGVEFGIVGAYAMAAWGYVRVTGDIDILVLPSKENSKRVYAALEEFGAPLGGVSQADFQKTDLVYQMGRPPLRADILTSLTGVRLTDDLMSLCSQSDVFGLTASNEKRAKWRRTNWSGGVVGPDGKDRVPLATFPKNKEDILKNWAHLELLRSIFYPNPGRLDRSVGGLRRKRLRHE